MKNDLTCAVVRDLLPTVADGLASDETVAAVNAHMAGCQACRAILEDMKTPEPAADPVPQVDYLKKVRRRGWLRTLLISAAAVLCCAALAAVGVFAFGSQVNADAMLAGVKVQGQTVQISGQLLDSDRNIVRVRFVEEDGVITVHVYAAPVLFSAYGTTTEVYTAKQPVRQVVLSGGRAEDEILWENGTFVSRLAARLYNARNPYVGDMSANARVANALRLVNRVGPFTNQLQTTAAPYGWQLTLEKPPVSRDTLFSCAGVLMACIDNLDYVTWQTADGTLLLNVTAAQVSEAVQQDIKAWKTAAQLEALLPRMGVIWMDDTDLFLEGVA